MLHWQETSLKDGDCADFLVASGRRLSKCSQLFHFLERNYFHENKLPFSYDDGAAPWRELEAALRAFAVEYPTGYMELQIASITEAVGSPFPSCWIKSRASGSIYPSLTALKAPSKMTRTKSASWWNSRPQCWYIRTNWRRATQLSREPRRGETVRRNVSRDPLLSTSLESSPGPLALDTSR
jgi:hypothetical protein